MRFGVMAAATALVAVVACGDPGSSALLGGGATGTVQGADPLFAAPVVCTPSPSSCGTWSYLYACYFGGKQAASGGCAGSGNDCHSTATSTGAIPSGFICGGSQESCYQGITSQGDPSIGALVRKSSKNDNGLLVALYRAGTTSKPTANNMPASSSALGSPPFTSASWPGFQQADIDCINTWVNAGAPDN